MKACIWKGSGGETSLAPAGAYEEPPLLNLKWRNKNGSSYMEQAHP
ncbi:uncharacterized protein PITG_06078 [Phytophthora infestans T30-4]|uniref:Uncharacterized protein n=1 Tax=Phytophthora infestans (strain T30-4) TaxID=403677 RepID=D0N6C6_PHYIT|nr:uncharacterized protein PITG_06078 [Phytophthora infestans T30-4]EEY70617.1 hypothetical protein PITG_06078 [Phytophthora infestans T30-4]|eukprot:XP_002998271.1 hypothetical protein PITG_06078 [Phytophthora infestans T30-4]